MPLNNHNQWNSKKFNSHKLYQPEVLHLDHLREEHLRDHLKEALQQGRLLVDSHLLLQLLNSKLNKFSLQLEEVLLLAHLLEELPKVHKFVVLLQDLQQEDSQQDHLHKLNLHQSEEVLLPAPVEDHQLDLLAEVFRLVLLHRLLQAGVLQLDQLEEALQHLQEEADQELQHHQAVVLPVLQLLLVLQLAEALPHQLDEEAQVLVEAVLVVVEQLDPMRHSQLSHPSSQVQNSRLSSGSVSFFHPINQIPSFGSESKSQRLTKLKSSNCIQMQKQFKHLKLRQAL